jgi:hypothetical protein
VFLSFLGRYLWFDKVYCFEGLEFDAKVYPQPDDLGDRGINPQPEGNTPDPSVNKMIY